MKKLNNVIFIIWIFFMSICMEWVRGEYEIPVTLLDLVLFPISLAFSFFSLKWLVTAKQDDCHPAETTKKKLLANFVILSLIVIPFGGWSVTVGIAGPFEYFHGVRGSAHGYTLASVGILLIIVWALFAVELTRKLTNGKKHND